jgi:hypothetical protein
MNSAANLNNDAAVQHHRASGYYESELRFFFLVFTKLHRAYSVSYRAKLSEFEVSLERTYLDICTVNQNTYKC